MDNAVIAAEIAKPAYAGMTDYVAIADQVNKVTVPGPNIDVPVATVLGDLMLGPPFLLLAKFAQGAFTSDPVHDAALGIAMTLMALLTNPNAPPFRMSDPATFAKIKGMMDALLAEETATPNSTGFTQAVHDSFIAAAQTTVPLWQAVGAPHPLDFGDIIAAKGETWESRSIPNYRLLSLVWVGGVVTGTTETPLPFTSGTHKLTVSACLPNGLDDPTGQEVGYDGTFDCQIVDANTFTYSLVSKPPSYVLKGNISAWQLGNVALAT